VPPPFNVDAYAKDSDAKVGVTAAGDAPGARSERRLITRPKMVAAITDEGWARDMTGLLAALPLEQLKGMPLDHRAGYLLSWMDGSIDLEMLVEVSTMPRDEVLRIVRDLYEAGIVEFR
jgi:hypothetical protein